MLRSLSNSKFTRGFFSTIFVILFSVCLSGMAKIDIAEAASLTVVPSISKVTVGNIVSVKIIVGTGGKAINNSDGTIQFASDLLDVVSIGKNSSIFTMWVEEPKFSNSAGTITWNGGLPNPGYVGEYGEVVAITFRAKKAGTASVMFTDIAVRQNDGFGTDILSSKNVGTIEISPAAQVKPVVPVTVPAVASVPVAPVVTSASHPDSDKWYSNPNVDLKWEVPSDVTSVTTLIDRNADSVPTVVYEPAINNKKINALEDGIWYFHARFKNKNGNGAIAHFRIQIDTVAPNPFKITFENSNSDNPRPAISFSTTDDLSGMERYEIKIGDSAQTRVSTDEVAANSYKAPAQDPGLHSVSVKAFDRAGNAATANSEFTVIALDTPVIKEYSKELTEDDFFKVNGSSYPSIDVELLIENHSGQKQSQLATTDGSGGFAYVWTKSLPKDTYSLKARAIDKRGAKSLYTSPVSFTVSVSPTRSSSLALNWLWLLIIIVILLGLIILLITYLVKRGSDKAGKSGSLKGLICDDPACRNSFNFLCGKVAEQIKVLKDAKAARPLTNEEQSVLEKLEQALVESEEYLGRKNVGNDGTILK